MERIVERLLASDAEALDLARELIDGGKGTAAFREAGGLLPLCGLFVSEAESGGSWSIAAAALADLCLERESRVIVTALRPEAAIVSLFETCPGEEDTTKLCRLVANLAVDVDSARRFHSEGVASHLVTVVKKKPISSPIGFAAVRAVKSLLRAKECRRELIEAEVPGRLTAALIKRCLATRLMDGEFLAPKTPAPALSLKKRDRTVCGLLKCISAFADRADVSCRRQIWHHGAGYKCIVVLTDQYEELALDCVLKLSHCPEARAGLCTAGVVERLLELTKLKHRDPVNILSALYTLCKDCACRSRLSDAGGLSAIVEILKFDEDIFHQYYALKILHAFVFNICKLISMAREEFVTIISEMLIKDVDKMKIQHRHYRDGDDGGKRKTGPQTSAGKPLGDDDRKDGENLKENENVEKLVADEEGLSHEESPPKRSRMNPKERKTIKENSPCMSPYSGGSTVSNSSSDRCGDSRTFKYAGFHSAFNSYHNRSPEFTGSGQDAFNSAYGTSSPWSPVSPAYSPGCASHHNESSHSDVSEHYSPVCSETEDKDDGVRIRQEDDYDRDAAVVDADEDRPVKYERHVFHERKIEEIRMHKIKYNLQLLYQYSYIPKKSFRVYTSCNIQWALVNYIEKIKRPSGTKAGKLLLKICSNPINFKHIIRNPVFFHFNVQIQKLRHSICRSCQEIRETYKSVLSQMIIIAETDYGMKEIFELLLKQGPIRNRFLICLPNILKTERSFKKVFIEFKAIDRYLDLLSNNGSTLGLLVMGLAKIVSVLGIRAPEPICRKYTGFNYPKYTPTIQEHNEITFVLDDSSTVRADRKFLCLQSDVFAAMLHGDFKEGLQKKVRLQKVTKEALEYLLVLLHGHQTFNKICPLPKSLTVALEAFLLADRYLIEKVKRQIFDSVVQFMLNPSTAAQMYIWSLEEGVGNFCMESVAYTLASKITDEKKIKIVSKLMNTDYKEQWIQDVRINLLRVA